MRVGSIMNEADCKFIEKITARLHAGEDPEKVVPYDLQGLSPQCRREVYMLYLKFGGNEKRRAEARRRYLNESG